MTYRIQFKASFNNSNANSILNNIESRKMNVDNTYNDVVRKAEKNEVVEEFNIINHAYVDFDDVEGTHIDVPSVTELDVDIDISFQDQDDFFDCINYLETIKTLAINTKYRMCRNFICNHNTNPVLRDSGYKYMDFDGIQLTYPLI